MAILDRFQLDEQQCRLLAGAFGTPLYVMSERHMRERIQSIRQGLAHVWPNSRLSYASKANGALALIQIALDEGCGIDVAGSGELHAALAAGAAPGKCHLHGNAKTHQEMAFAAGVGIGQIVIDNIQELEVLEKLELSRTELLIRINPEVDAHLPQKINTSHRASKFGLPISDGQAELAVKLCRQKKLPLRGFHIHVGSMVRDSAVLRQATEVLVRFALEMERLHAVELGVINIGGGFGVRQLASETPIDLEALVTEVAEAAATLLTGRESDILLKLEPGRSVVAESGVTLYSVVATKGIAGEQYVSVDGGLSDNPSPGFYSRAFDVLAMTCAGAETMSSVFGAHCESDLLFTHVPLPSNLQRDDLLQVLVTGAYNASMASQYNRFRRPAMVLQRMNGDFQVIQERDDWKRNLERERLLST